MGSLRQGLDRAIYDIITKFEAEAGLQGRDKLNIKIHQIYDYIQKSTSSLKRNKKRPLEDAIDRVLELRRQAARADAAAAEDSYDSDAELEKVLAAEEEKKNGSGGGGGAGVDSASRLNMQLTKHWDFAGKKGSKRKADEDDFDLIEGKRFLNEGDEGGVGSGGQEGAEVVRSVTGKVPQQTANGLAVRKRRRRDEEGTSKRIFAHVMPFQDQTLDHLAGAESLVRIFSSPTISALLEACQSDDKGTTCAGDILVHGPIGVGKTFIIRELAQTLQRTLISVDKDSLETWSTEDHGAKRLKDAFDEAIRIAPSLLVLDNVEEMAGKPDSSSRAQEGSLSSAIVSSIDKLEVAQREGKHVTVIATTVNLDKVDSKVRAKFSGEVEISPPAEKAREQILRNMCSSLLLTEDVDFAAVARATTGYVAADLKKMVRGARAQALKDKYRLRHRRADNPDYDITEFREDEERELEELRSYKKPEGASPPPPCRLNTSHFQRAVARIRPFAKREGFSDIPTTSWSQVGALHSVKHKLRTSIAGPIQDPEFYAQFGLQGSAGVLLWGPPGCGKTLVAQAVANEARASFISIKGPELLSKYVGDSERAVRDLFKRAKTCAPCILFFDELDALAPRRDGGTGAGSIGEASSRVVNTLLTELDGVGDRTGIYVIGATNRPDYIDAAIRRPGRLGTLVFLGLPSAEERVDILNTLYWNSVPGKAMAAKGILATVQQEEVLRNVAMDGRCSGFSGADMWSLLQTAGECALNRQMLRIEMEREGGKGKEDGGDNGGGKSVIKAEDWESALGEVRPSVKDAKQYEKMLN